MAASMLRHCYMRFVSGSSSKEYLLFVYRVADTFVTKAFYGRIGAGGSQETEKYRGPDLGKALAAYDKVQREKLKEGYLDSDGYRLDRALMRKLQDIGATAGDIVPELGSYREPELMSLKGANDAGILSSPGWHWYMGSADRWLVTIDADQNVQMIKMQQGNAAALSALSGNVRDFSRMLVARDLDAAGMLPAALEITGAMSGYHIIEVHELRGMKAELPGEQRLMLWQEIIDAMPIQNLAMPRLIGSSMSMDSYMLKGYAVVFGIELAGIRRVMIANS